MNELMKRLERVDEYVCWFILFRVPVYYIVLVLCVCNICIYYNKSKESTSAQ